MAVLLILPVRNEVTRLIPYGARIDAFLVDNIDWRISVIHGCLCSSACRLRFHGVANVNWMDVACRDTDMLSALCDQESLIDHPGFW